MEVTSPMYRWNRSSMEEHKDSLRAILDMIPAAQRDVLDPLYQQLEEKFAGLDQNTVKIVFHGSQGSWKSGTLNRIACPESWLIERGLPIEWFGRYPLASRDGTSVTPFPYRLFKRQLQNESPLFQIEVRFSENFPQEELQADAKNLVDLLAPESILRRYRQQEVNGKPKHHLIESIDVYGDWDFSTGIVITDLPGYRHSSESHYNSSSDERNLRHLMDSTVIMFFGNRPGDLALVKSALEEKAIQRETVIASVYHSDKIKDGAKVYNYERDFSTLLGGLAEIFTVPLPHECVMRNYVERQEFFNYISGRARVFRIDDLCDPPSRERIFGDLKILANATMAQDVNNSLSQCLLAARCQTTKTTITPRTLWMKAMKAVSAPDLTRSDFLKLAKELPVTVFHEDDDAEEKSRKGYIEMVRQHVRWVLVDEMKESIVSWEHEIYKHYASLWLDDEVDHEDGQQQLVNMVGMLSQIKDQRRVNAVVSKLKSTELEGLLQKISSTIDEVERDLLQSDPDTQWNIASLKIKKLLETFSESAATQLIQVFTDIIQETKRKSSVQKIKMQETRVKEILDEIKKLIKNLNQVFAQWTTIKRQVHIPVDKCEKVQPKRLIDALEKEYKLKDTKPSKREVPTPMFTTNDDLTDRYIRCVPSNRELRFVANMVTQERVKGSLSHDDGPNKSSSLVPPVFIHAFVRDEDMSHFCLPLLLEGHPINIYIVTVGSDQTKKIKNYLEAHTEKMKQMEDNEGYIHKVSTWKKSNIYVMEMPDACSPAHAMDYRKLFVEMIGWPTSAEVDQYLKETKQWSRQRIGSCASCDVQGVVIGLDHLMRELHACDIDDLLKLAVGTEKAVERIEGRKLRIQMGQQRRRFKQFQENMQLAEVDQEQLIQYLENIPPREEEESMDEEGEEREPELNPEDWMNKTKDKVGMLLLVPAMFQVTECVANYPNYFRIIKDTRGAKVQSDDKARGKRGLRKMEGIIVNNTSVLREYWYTPVNYKLSNPKRESSEYNMDEWHEQIVRARQKIFRNMREDNRYTVLIRVWGYSLKKKGSEKKHMAVKSSKPEPRKSSPDKKTSPKKKASPVKQKSPSKRQKK